jgi:hypothetical protein
VRKVAPRTHRCRTARPSRPAALHAGQVQGDDLPSERVGTLDEPSLHYNFSQWLAAWLRKHLNYADALNTVIAIPR